MYISNVKKCNFFFSRFFLKKEERKNIFSGKNFKNKKKWWRFLSPHSASLSSRPSPRSESTVALWERSERGQKSVCLWVEGFCVCSAWGFFGEGDYWEGEPGGCCLFLFFFPSFFFSLAKEEYNQSFVFGMLCNILERDIGVSRDLVKNKQKNPTKRLIKSVQFLLFQIFLSLY